MVEELSLGTAGVEHSQKLCQPPQGVGGETALVVPKSIHLQSVAHTQTIMESDTDCEIVAGYKSLLAR